MPVDFVHDSGFETLQFFFRERVRLGDDGDDVDFVVERFHEGDVQGLQSMARWRNEIEAAVDAVVADVASIQTGFVLEILFELFVDVSDDGLEATVVIDGIAVTGSVDDS